MIAEKALEDLPNGLRAAHGEDLGGENNNLGQVLTPEKVKSIVAESYRQKVTSAQKFVAEKEQAVTGSGVATPSLQEFKEFQETLPREEWYHEYLAAEESMFGKRVFLFLCQMLLLAFLWVEIVYGERGLNYDEPPQDMKIVICRFLCAIFLHITLLDVF